MSINSLIEVCSKENVKELEHLYLKGRSSIYYLTYSILGLSILTSLKLDCVEQYHFSHKSSIFAIVISHKYQNG